MVMLTPTSQFTNDQVFMTPWMGSVGIADLVIIVNTYPVEGLYINDKPLDVSTTLMLCYANDGHLSAVNTALVQVIRCEPLDEHLIPWTCAVFFHTARK